MGHASEDSGCRRGGTQAIVLIITVARVIIRRADHVVTSVSILTSAIVESTPF